MLFPLCLCVSAYKDLSVCKAGEGGDDDDVDGRDAEGPDGEGADDGDPDGVAVEFCPLSQSEGGYGDEGYDGRSDTSEDGRHVGIVLELAEKDCYCQDDQERG